MNKSLIIFSREWTVTAALAALLLPSCSNAVTAVYSLTELEDTLREQPGTPVVLGLRPHEHVADLYRLRPLLAGRAIMFVGRCFFWTDYSLPEWLRLGPCRFCTWDAMQGPISRWTELKRFFRLPAACQEGHPDPETAWSQELPQTDEEKILDVVNHWLYLRLSEAGLTRSEIRVLVLLSEGRNRSMPPRLLSVHKKNGLSKLGMSLRLMNLFRGLKVRAELQSELADTFTKNRIGEGAFSQAWTVE
ncbi:TPA: hypothetical protein ACWMDS_004658 [Escherichia coli]